MTLYWNDLQDVQKLQDILNRDRIAIVSGDTVLGLLGRLTKKSYEQLDNIKGRSNKPYLLLIKSLEMLPHFVDQNITLQLEQLMSLVWPGPVTLIFKARNDIPAYMKSADGTIAVRVPHHEGLQELLQHYDGLFSTSANLHGCPIPQTVADLDPELIAKVAATCVQEGQLEYPILPSTILDCSKNKITIIREGCCLSDKVKEIAGL